MSNHTRKWLRTGLETAIHGGWAALAIGYTSWDMSITWKQWWTLVIAGFMANGGLRAIQYFQNNPLPPEESDLKTPDGKSLVPQPIISLNPLAKVQTMSEGPKP